MASAIYYWDISNVILQPSTWVYSPTQPLIKGYNKVGFELALRMNIDSNSLYVVVRKNHVRPAKATVEIQLLKQDKDMTFGGYDYDELGAEFASTKYPYIIFVPDRKMTTTKKVMSNWGEFCTFDAFTSLSCMNTTYVRIPDECRVKYTTICCKITGFSFILEEPTEGNLARQESCVQWDFREFLKEGLFSDVVLVVDGQELPTHKVVLSSHSQFFYKMLTTDTKESKTNRIEIKNFSADLIFEMLEYFYTKKTKASNDVAVAQKLIELAKTYEIITLKELCEATLKKYQHE